jgi:hypothetical protein
MLDSVVGPDGEPVVGPRGDGDPTAPPGGATQSQVRVGYVVLPQDPAECGFLLAEWTDEEMATALDAARAAVRVLRRGRFSAEESGTRAGEEDRDALRPLLIEGWQASGDADEDDDAASGAGDGAGDGTGRSVSAEGRA